MPALILVLILFVTYLAYRKVVVQPKERAESLVTPAPDRPAPPRHQRVSDEELDRRAAALNDAVADGTISADEAAQSLARTCGLDLADARTRISTDGSTGGASGSGGRRIFG